MADDGTAPGSSRIGLSASAGGARPMAKRIAAGSLARRIGGLRRSAGCCPPGRRRARPCPWPASKGTSIAGLPSILVGLPRTLRPKPRRLAMFGGATPPCFRPLASSLTPARARLSWPSGWPSGSSAIWPAALALVGPRSTRSSVTLRTPPAADQSLSRSSSGLAERSVRPVTVPWNSTFAGSAPPR